MSFLIRSTLQFEPIELDFFISKVIDMIDECVHQNGGELPTLKELTDFRIELSAHLVKKLTEIFSDSNGLA
jgi:hypothetical protein